MREINVDIIRLQPSQRCLGGSRDVGSRQTLAARRHLHSNLGRNHHVLAIGAALQPCPNDRLRFAAAMSGHPNRIGIGGIDEVEPGAHERIEHRARGCLGRGPSKDVAAEAQGSDLYAGAAEGAKLHGDLWSEGLEDFVGRRRSLGARNLFVSNMPIPAFLALGVVLVRTGGRSGKIIRALIRVSAGRGRLIPLLRCVLSCHELPSTAVLRWPNHSKGHTRVQYALVATQRLCDCESICDRRCPTADPPARRKSRERRRFAAAPPACW